MVIFFRNISLSRKFYSFFSISRSNKMNLHKFYFRHVEVDNKVDITFLLNVKDFARQFNFSRNANESLKSLVQRMDTNIQKAIDKAYKKMKNVTRPSTIIEFYNDKNEPISEEHTCLELFDLPGPVNVKICEQVYEVVFNAPWIVNVSLPQSILAGFPVYPEHFVTFYTEKEKTSFKWFRGWPLNENKKEKSDMHIDWEVVGNKFIYEPSSEDIGYKLKLECVPGNTKTTGPVTETISKSVIEAGPGKCPFETRHVFTSSYLNGKSFRCVSYNILADLYCDSDHTRTVLHPYCPPYALHIDYRKQLIMKELYGYHADIMCLQEVDRKIFNHCLQPFLEAEGFSGCFYRKGKEVAEGLACFYRTNRFKFIGERTTLLAEAVQSEECCNTIWKRIKNNQPFKERLLDRSTVASATILQSVENNDEIIVAGNTHLYFHPDADHIRVTQGGITIYWLREIRKQIMEENPCKRVSLIICGDFNSVPSCGIYQLYTTGIAPSTLPDWTSNEKETVKDLALEQDIPLASACGTPEFTNFTDGFADCLDYIYYEKNNLLVEQVVPFPSEEELRAHIALPSIVFPSDHIALVADLQFT